MEIDQKNNKATLRKNVVAIQKDQTLKADKLEVYFNPETQQIKQMVCTGNVEIIQGENSTFSQRAIYNAIEKKIILTGRPKLIFVMEQKKGDEEAKP
jgi:lipopolysaccharide transport protein LptA